MGNTVLADISLAVIKTDRNTQVREAIDDSLWREYKELILSGVELPPIDIFQDKDCTFILADGFHRFYAHREAKLTTIKARVHNGDKTDAVWFAAGANRGHGKRMTTADKQEAARLLLLSFPNYADGRIAKQIGCDPKTVAKVRTKLESTREIPELKERVGADGKSRSTPAPSFARAAEVAPIEMIEVDEEKIVKTPEQSLIRSTPAVTMAAELVAAARRGKGVTLANEAINALSRIPKNDKLRARAWEIVRDWLDANEGGAK